MVIVKTTYVVPYKAIFWTFVTSAPDWLSSIKIVKLIENWIVQNNQQGLSIYDLNEEN